MQKIKFIAILFLLIIFAAILSFTGCINIYPDGEGKPPVENEQLKEQPSEDPKQEETMPEVGGYIQNSWEEIED